MLPKNDFKNAPQEQTIQINAVKQTFSKHNKGIFKSLLKRIPETNLLRFQILIANFKSKRNCNKNTLNAILFCFFVLKNYFFYFNT